jgi:hypothetical protein
VFTRSDPCQEQDFDVWGMGVRGREILECHPAP